MEPVMGEYLSDLAGEMSDRRITIVEAGPDPDTAIAVIKLALVLRGRPLTQFRAIVEEWDHRRIVRELY